MMIFPGTNVPIGGVVGFPRLTPSVDGGGLEVDGNYHCDPLPLNYLSDCRGGLQ